MALLLAMYQKMRLVREKNQLTLDATKMSAKKKRVQDNIKSVQKRYTSILQNVKSQAEMAQKQYSVWVNNMAGLGCTNGFNPWSFGGTQLTQFVMNGMAQWASQGSKNKDGEEIVSSGKAGEIWQAYQASGGQYTVYKNEDGSKYLDVNDNEVDSAAAYKFGNGVKCTVDEFNAFQAAMNQVQMGQTQAQAYVQQQTQQYGSNVSIWQQAMEAQIEAEQDAALEPLNYEDTMLDLDIQLNNTRLEQIKQELETYNALVKDEIKNSTPTFGLQ